MTEKKFVIRATSTAKNKETLVKFFAIDTGSGCVYFSDHLSHARFLTKEEAQKEFDDIRNEKHMKLAGGAVVPGYMTYGAAGLCNARPESHVVFEIMEVQLSSCASFTCDVKV